MTDVIAGIPDVIAGTPDIIAGIPDVIAGLTGNPYYGTSTALMISEMIWSVVMFSASAS